MVIVIIAYHRLINIAAKLTMVHIFIYQEHQP